MSLFPQLDLNYYIPQDDKNLLVKMDRAYTPSHYHQSGILV